MMNREQIITDAEIARVRELKEADERKKAKAPKPFVPRPRVRNPWRGTLNWARHKEKLAGKRKARNIAGRKTRRAQRRAQRRAS